MNQTQEAGLNFQERGGMDAESWEISHSEHLARYYYAVGFVRGLRVLDAGTGKGYGAALLKLMGGAHTVQAVDIDDSSIAEARVRFPIEGLEYLADDCETLEKASGPFDVICSFENIEHLQRPEQFVKSSARLLADDGVLYCSTPDRDAAYAAWVNGKPSNPYHVNEWYHDEYKELLSESFGSVEILSQVQSLSCVRRTKAIEGLYRHLDYLWSDPVLKAMRAAGKAMGRSFDWPEFRGLAATSPADYPVVNRCFLGVLGVPFCHYAVCRNPRR